MSIRTQYSIQLLDRGISIKSQQVRVKQYAPNKSFSDFEAKEHTKSIKQSKR